MLQNSSSNKFSSFIGIILLFLVLGFTVFINFFVEETTEEIKVGKDVILEEEVLEDTLENPYNKPFTENDLANFWKLEHIHTDSIVVNTAEKRTYMKIYRELGFTKLNPFRDSSLIKILGDSKMRELYKDVSISRYTIYNGIISFKYIENTDSSSVESTHFLINFHINYMEAQDFELAMREIASLIIHYQIKSITTLPKAGNFTKIEFKDGRKLFLIKKDAEILEESYKQKIKTADYLNDSTKVVLPYSANL